MNVSDIVMIARKRPGIYFGSSRDNLLTKTGFFIDGFVCAGLDSGSADGFDRFFASGFHDFVKKRTGAGSDEFKLWHEIINDQAPDGKQAFEIFLEYFDEFYGIYKNKMINNKPKIPD